MTDFYKRYKNLFSLRDNPTYNNFDSNRHLFSRQFEPFYSLPQREYKASNYLNIGRSPALEQFQKKVLPSFGKAFPQQQFSRLKTEMDQSTLKMNQRLNKNFNKKIQFYQLPTLNTKRAQIPMRQRIMTEGNQTLKKDNFAPKERKNMNKKIEELQKQYFERPYPNYQDKVIDKNQTLRLQQSRLKSKTEEQPQLIFSRFQKVKQSNPIKRWNVKVLPDIQKKKNKEYSQLTPRRNEPTSSQFKLYQSRQKQLYGLRQNQYAFVNGKLEDIRKAEKYYPRGYINSYRQALFRRKQSKNLIQERRIKLKMLLYSQDSIK